MGTILNMDVCNADQRRRMAALVRMYKAQGLPETEAQKRAWAAMFDELAGGVPVMAQQLPAETQTESGKSDSSEPSRKQLTATGSRSKKAQREAQGKIQAEIAARNRANDDAARVEASKQPTDIAVLGLTLE